eukprot:4940181-Prymnesium_polylepis.1
MRAWQHRVTAVRARYGRCGNATAMHRIDAGATGDAGGGRDVHAPCLACSAGGSEPTTSACCESSAVARRARATSTFCRFSFGLNSCSACVACGAWRRCVVCA